MVFDLIGLVFGLSELTLYQSKLAIIPIIVYNNVGEKQVKEAVVEDNKGNVYKWVNTLTKECYIGSSVDLSRRILYYFNIKYMTNYKSKSIIYSALLKYGHKVFKLEILEYCDKELVVEREQYYINTLKPRYNILNIAGSSLGFRHSETTRANMSLNNTKEKHPFYGRKHTEESKVKMALSSPLAKAVEVIDVETGEKKFFNSNVQAAKYLNVSEWTIRSLKKSKKIYKDKY